MKTKNDCRKRSPANVFQGVALNRFLQYIHQLSLESMNVCKQERLAAHVCNQRHSIPVLNAHDEHRLNSEFEDNPSNYSFDKVVIVFWGDSHQIIPPFVLHVFFLFVNGAPASLNTSGCIYSHIATEIFNQLT